MWQEIPGFLWVKGKRKFLRPSILNLDVQKLQRDAVKAFYGESPLHERSHISRNKYLPSQFLDYR